MLAEILLTLAGHTSSLFQADNTLHPEFVSLLHPGEVQCLESLGLIALRYRNIKAACNRLTRSSSRYVCAVCAKLNDILKDGYEHHVVETEAKILRKDDSFVGQGSFVPLSAIRATFAEWDSPLAALESVTTHLETTTTQWPPGLLIDLLLEKSNTGVHRISSIMSALAIAVQQTWKAQLQIFLVHGTVSTTDPLLTEDLVFMKDALPSCLSETSRDSILYVGKAIATVKSSNWRKQVPSSLSIEHTRLLELVLPQDQHAFDRVIARIRADVSEWLWLNVLTLQDVDDVIDFLANYFLLRNGEFSLALIQEIEQLKSSRLTGRTGNSNPIREQDLQPALLRASVGTSAQHDPRLAQLQFKLPSGAVRPLLQPLSHDESPDNASLPTGQEIPQFDDVLLGAPIRMNYAVSWPLSLVLRPSDLAVYADLFSFLSSLRHIQTRIHTCWISLSNAQRARRRWTGLDEGGIQDSASRKELLRCGWGIVRQMGWFTDVLIGYTMNDVVDSEFRRLKKSIRNTDATTGHKLVGSVSRSIGSPGKIMSHATKESMAPSNSAVTVSSSASQNVDFTTLRGRHTTYLERLQSGLLLTQPSVMVTIRAILDTCERFVGRVERWGGDVLPALLFEGSISTGGSNGVGTLVQERWQIVKDVDENLRCLLGTFYEQLSSSSVLPVAETSRSMLMNSTNTFNASTRQRWNTMEQNQDSRRHVEHLLLRLDLNRAFSKTRREQGTTA